MVAIAHSGPVVRTPGRPSLRLVRSPARQPQAVYRRRRLGALLLVACVALVAAGAVASVRGGGATATRVEVTPGPASIVHDPAAYGATHTPPPAGSVYVVQPGDTLWSIARSLAPDGDVRAEVDRLVDLNGGAAVEPGQRLRLAPSTGP